MYMFYGCVLRVCLVHEVLALGGASITVAALLMGRESGGGVLDVGSILVPA